MKQRISPFQYSSYREFLRVALKEKGHSYRSFAAKHGDVISFIMLAQSLSRGRSGTESRPMRNISPETLARLGKVLKLGEDEITFLLLLKMENDSVTLPGVYGSAYIDNVRTMIKEQKNKLTHGANEKSSHRARYSQSAETIAEFMDLLPEAAKLRLSREILVEGKGILSRQKHKAGVKKLASVIQRLERLVSMGI